MPNVLVAMVNMVLDGPSIKNQSLSSSTQAALSIAQLLNFNIVKQRRKQGAAKTQEPPAVRHSTSQETPLLTYVGLMLHAETRKRGLVDKLFSLGLNISHERRPASFCPDGKHRVSAVPHRASGLPAYPA